MIEPKNNFYSFINCIDLCCFFECISSKYMPFAILLLDRLSSNVFSPFCVVNGVNSLIIFPLISSNEILYLSTELVVMFNVKTSLVGFGKTDSNTWFSNSKIATSCKTTTGNDAVSSGQKLFIAINSTV